MKMIIKTEVRFKENAVWKHDVFDLIGMGINTWQKQAQTVFHLLARLICMKRLKYSLSLMEEYAFF